MGRYDRDSGRYSRFQSKQSSGIPTVVVFILIVCSALAGFFARPFIDSLIEPASRLLTLADGPAKSPEAKPTTETKAPEAEAATGTFEQLETPPAVVILPELDSSDSEIRNAITTVSPELAPWLKGEGLIRKFMVLVNDFSQGLRINKHLDFIKLPQSLTVKETNDGIFIAPESYQRYNALAMAIDHIDVTALSTVYKTFNPLLLQVFKEFSYPEDYPIETMLNKAAMEILSAPIIEGPIPLTKQSVRYQFADPQLEALNPVHKQMLRMGPENTRIIQDKVRDLLGVVK